MLGVIMHSGIGPTAIVAVLFNEITLGKKPGASVMAAAETERDKLGDTLDDEMKGQQKPPVMVRTARRRPPAVSGPLTVCLRENPTSWSTGGSNCCDAPGFC